MVSIGVSHNYTRLFRLPKLPDGNIAGVPYAERMGFGERLSEAREAKGLSGTALGAKLGVSKATISHWENGVNRPSLVQLNALCDELGVSADWLIDRAPLDLSAEAIQEARAFEALPPEGRRKWKAMRLTMFSPA